jgi:hypothetical protein
MRQMTACLLIAAGIAVAGYCADKTLVPLATSGCDANTDMSDVVLDLIPDWHFKEPHFRKPCLGLCPKRGNWP